MKNLHPHRQFGDITPEADQSTRAKLLQLIAAIAITVGALAIATHWDAKAEQYAELSDQRVQQQLDRIRADEQWLHRMAAAYARGRDDALRAQPGTPEGQVLAQACSTLK
jgi:hypothetical protein